MKRLAERIAEGLLAGGGAVTTLVIVLMVVFLFKEGMGFFGQPAVERGYALCVRPDNPVERLTPEEIRRLFDGEITDWREVGGRAEPVVPFRLEEIFDRYSDEALGEDYALLPEKLGEVMAATPGIIAFLPEDYLPEAKILDTGTFTPAAFFGGREWMPAASPAPLFGLLPLLMGTLWVGLFAIVMALPLGLGVAIYLSELAGRRTRQWFKPAVELLAGIPSVVYGFFGLAVLAPLIQRGLRLPVGETAFTGSLVLAVMALPTIITLAEDAMRNTPAALREASLGLGANHWQTICRVIVPYSASGISAAVVLGIGRAIGETRAVLMVTGNAAILPHSLFEPVRTLPATIAAELGEAPGGGAHYQALFLLGCVLFLITLLVSVAAEMMSRRQPKWNN
jgi:phosphate transport system permease protein